MVSLDTIAVEEIDDLTALLARKITKSEATILLFTDFTDFMADLLKTFYKPGSRLVTAGHVTPEIDLAADRAEVELIEALGSSSFASDADSVLTAIKSPHDLIYLANPNRLTGAGFSFTDLDKLARAIPQGTLLIDEYYIDYSGVSAFHLLDILTNIVILRSFAAYSDTSSSDTGYILANPETVNVVKDRCLTKPISSNVRKTIIATLSDEEALSTHLHQTQKESLRLASILRRLKVQCRVTPTDFLLLRVANTKNVGDYLARYKVPTDNLGCYPHLEDYLRYRIQSPNSNDRLIEAFKKMPASYYLMNSVDHQSVTLRRKSDSS